MEELKFYIAKAREINKKYAGKHIAIVGDKVVASGNSAKEVLNRAKKKYPKRKPVLTYVPKKDTLVRDTRFQNKRRRFGLALLAYEFFNFQK